MDSPVPTDANDRGVRATQAEADHGVRATQADHGVRATQADHGVRATQAEADQGPDDEILDRLLALEARVDALSSSLRETVTQELRVTTEELRRAVSDLGRLLLRDLERLTRVLADHRDAIVDRLLEAASAIPTADEPAPPPPPPAEAPPAPLTGEHGRWWVPLPRRVRLGHRARGRGASS